MQDLGLLHNLILQVRHQLEANMYCASVHSKTSEEYPFSGCYMNYESFSSRIAMMVIAYIM
jgi:hypothetical protein